MSVVRGFHSRWVHGRRARRLVAELAKLIPPGCRLLDVGCGDGLVASLIGEIRPDVHVQGIEALVRQETKVPVLPFDGESIPYSDGDFDMALMVDVLHHAANPKALMREAARVGRGQLLIKDHLLEGVLAGPTLRVMDWVANARRGFALPENYWSHEQWLRVFEELGLEIERWVGSPRLYPVPFDWVFGRSLHFVALLAAAGEQASQRAPTEG